MNELNIIYITFFIAFCIIAFLILRASNLEKFFKQGKITEIRFAYIILSVIISYLTTMAFVEFLNRIFNLFK